MTGSDGFAGAPRPAEEQDFRLPSGNPMRLGPSAADRCRRRIHLDAQNAEQRQFSAAAQRAAGELADHRGEIFERLRSVHADLIGPPEFGERSMLPSDSAADPAVRRTVRGRGGPVVLLPQMATEIRSGAADIAVWVGDGYLPVIVRAHRTRDSGAGAQCSSLDEPWNIRTDPQHRIRRHRADRLALAHHYRQLQERGCASASRRGGVIGRGSPTDGAGRQDKTGLAAPLLDDSSVIVWHDLDRFGASVLQDYDNRFADRTAVALAAVRGDEPLAFPSRIAECRRCRWWPTCSVELHASGDISLLLSGDDVGAARAAGVHTVPDLAKLSRSSAAALPLTGIHPASARVRARAWQQGLPLVRSGPRASVKRADVELDVDAESYGEDGAYLWGAQLSGEDVGIPAGYRAFVTWRVLPSPAQGEVFGEFFRFVLQVRQAAVDRGLSFATFCYGKAAEERWMLGLARRYGTASTGTASTGTASTGTASTGTASTGTASNGTKSNGTKSTVPNERTVADFCASSQWVDLLAEIKRQFVAPGSLRLKDVAGSMGFSWRDPEPGGENSMAWYQAAVVNGPPRSVQSVQHSRGEAEMSQAQAVQRVLQYNEDDVRATLAVRRWITENLGSLPTVAELDVDSTDPE